MNQITKMWVLDMENTQKRDRRNDVLKTIIFISFLFIVFDAISQRSVSGKVTDGTGMPVIGAQVSLKNTTAGTITDINGFYRITDSQVNSKSVLVFYYLGMKTKEEIVGDKTVINVIMNEESINLDELVVVGYGTMRKSDLTGSVGNVRINDIEKAPVLSFDQALSGRIAGVQVSSNDGQPGSGMEITIRGGNSLTQSNAPLYVIDGFPMEDDMNADINPDEIESINILKDASATAIYGARAANGVVVIETKKGQIGKPVINFNASYGLQDNLKTMDLMSPYDFVKYQLEMNSTKATERYLAEGKTLDSYANLKGYNWQDQVFRLAPMQSYSLAIRGGKDEIRYSVSGSVSDQQGIIINSGFKRYQGRASFDINLRKNLKFGVNTILSQTENYGQISSDTRGIATTALMYSVWGYRPITGEDNYADLEEELMDPDIDSSNDYRVNPIMNLKNELRKKTAFTMKSDAFLTYDISKDLKLKITGGISKKNERADAFYNSKTSRGTPQIPSNSARLTNGRITYTEGDSWTNENLLIYSKKFRKIHSISGLLGASFQGRQSSQYGLGAVMLPNESLGLSGLDEGVPTTVTAYESESKMASFFSRLNYNYKSRYLLTGTIRADGSSKFAKDNRWGYFPSGAFAWRINEEQFLKNVDFVSNTKLRLSYGLTGNNRVSDFAYLSGITLPLTASYSFNNGVPQNGAIPTEMGNSKLTWETTAQSNIGLDLGFFGNRIDIVLDLYDKITYDLLLYSDLPYLTGFPSVYNNIGKISNRGLEFTINTVNIKKKNFTWESNFNISFNKNRILELASDEMLSNVEWTTSHSKTPLFIAQVGGPAAQFYGYIFDGIYQYADFDELPDGKYLLKDNIPTNGNVRENIQPGDIKYKDIAGDDLVVNADDRTTIGNPYPIHTGGFNNNFSFKNITLGVFFQWSYGNEIYNANRLMFEGNVTSKYGLNQFASYIDRWTPENPSNTLYRTGGFGPAGVYSSREIEDGSYLRLKTLSLGYDIPKSILKKISFKELKLSFSIQNLFTWTKYSGMDPEVSVRSTILTPGFDYSAYPKARTFMFGINATL